MGRIDPPPARTLLFSICLSVCLSVASPAFGIARSSEEGFRRGDDGSYSATNGNAGLRVRLAGGRVEVTPLDEGAAAVRPSTWRMTLRLDAMGRDGALRLFLPNPPETSATNAGTVSMRRVGIDEWYLTDERGIEQGFTIEAGSLEAASAPAPAPADRAPLVLEMALGGDLLAYPDAARTSILFRTTSGRPALRYGGLRAEDATGRQLPAWMDVRPGTASDQSADAAPAEARLRILVDDRGATYPITIDPLLTSPDWSVVPAQAGAEFGSSVAAAGDVNGDGFADLLVGSPLYDGGQTDEGRVQLFLGSAAGLSLTASWSYESDLAGAHLGAAVASAGDVNGDGYHDILVGAPLWKNGQTDEGRALVFFGGPAGPGATPSWSFESNVRDAVLGSSVGWAGDVNGDGHADIVVGAPGYENGQHLEGGAFVFYGSPSGPAATPSRVYEGDQATSDFGRAVGTAGDVNGDGYADLLIGAPEWSNGQTDEGKAFLYYGSASGLAPAAGWSVELDQAGAEVGISVGTAGDVNGDGFADLFVGADLYSNQITLRGAVFIYQGSSSGPPAAFTTRIQGNQIGSRFGASASAAGDVNGDGYADLIVGAPDFDGAVTDEGRVFLFEGTPTGLSRPPSWATPGGQATAHWGSAVALAGDVDGDGYGDIAVGAWSFDGSGADTGKAAVFNGFAATSGPVHGWKVEGNQYTSYFSWPIVSAGDVNADGFDDVLLGSAAWTEDVYRQGRAWLFLGSAAGPSTSPAWIVQGAASDDAVGNSVASAGDVNGDGYDDVLVTNLHYDNAHVDAGRVDLYLGSATGLSTVSAWHVEGDQDYDNFGADIASAGDVNGDGYADVLIGAELYDGPFDGSGRVWLYLGSPTGLSTTHAWTRSGGQAEMFGSSVAAAGDVNRDGYGDVVIGAYNYLLNIYTSVGKAYVFLGGPGGLAATPNWTAVGTQQIGMFGQTAVSAGDVNGDGYSDVVVGEPEYDGGQQDEGRVHLFLGGPAGVSPTASWIVEGNAGLMGFGRALAAGDLNGDGYSDLIIGNPAFVNPGGVSGALQIYRGSASGLPLTPSQIVEAEETDSNFGQTVASAADVNGDGYADVLTGAPFYTGDVNYEGAAYVFYGNDGPGLSRAPRQFQPDSGARLAPLGVSSDADGFRLSAPGRWPEGRARVRLQWDVKPLGVPFDGTGLQSTAVTAVGGALGPVEVSSDISGLSPAQPFHWRARWTGSSPFFAATPWLTPPANGLTETDLRTRCDAAVPGGSPSLTIVRTGTTAQLSWSGVAVAAFDVVRGGVGALRSSGGNFGTATAECLGNNVSGTTLSHVPVPAAGEAFWYLVRGVATGTACSVAGTWDDGSASQIASRDSGIAASGNGCP